jgi:hypothetical protein
MYVRETPDGYRMRLSADDTFAWAHRPGARWPCSTLSGHEIVVVVDECGLVDYSGPDGADGWELDAIVSDFLPENLRHLWPAWEVGV